MRSSVEDLLKDADNYDNDKKFMAASDLCQELVKGTQFDNPTLERICNVFIKHLDEPTSDIKGNNSLSHSHSLKYLFSLQVTLLDA